MMKRSTLALAAMLLAGAVTTASADEAFDQDLYHANPNALSYWAETQTAPPIGAFGYSAAQDAYAQSTPRRIRHPRIDRGHAVNPNAVYENGKYIGQDPDPNVRQMLEQDFSFQ